MSWVLVVDVGNTSTSVGLARGKSLGRVSRVKGSITENKYISEVIKDACRDHEIAAAVLCSVVPAANMVWITQIKKQLGIYPMIVSHRLNIGIDISYPKPSSIGADRLADVCGAVYKYGAPAIVADFGTALTFDVIDADKGYIGGAIAPGLPIMTDYLADKTALLPYIELKGKCPSIGRSTEGAMRLGAKIGYRGIVRELVGYLMNSMGEKAVTLIATGGYARWALAGLDMPFHFEPNMTLHGLSRIYELNS